MKEESPVIPAATVVLVRDTPDGVETLMLRKNAALAFGGMWVFPGGRIDPEDGPGEEGARRAAVREAMEEAALLVPADVLVPFAHWTPPPISPKRFGTWFFLAPAPHEAEVVIDGGEIHEHVWTTAATALERHAATEIELAPPTWMTLRRLAACATVAEALHDAATRPVEIYETRLVKDDDGNLLILWEGDAGYDTSDPTLTGDRHRLHMRTGGWLLERSF